MSIINFHPEHLLEREMRGTLTPSERRRLHHHLAHCSACRLERRVRADFAEELVPPGTPANLWPLVQGVIIGASGSGMASGVEFTPRPPTPSLGVRRRRFATLFVAALALGSGLAAARTEMVRHAWQITQVKLVSRSAWLGGGETGATDGTPARPRVALRLAAGNGRQSASGWGEYGAVEPWGAPAPTLPASRASETTAAAPRPAASVSVAVKHSVLPAATRASEEAFRGSARAPAGSVDASSNRPRKGTHIASEPAGTSAQGPNHEALVAHPQESASLWFERANAARRQGNPLRAASLYHELQLRFPGSAEARLSVALMARMQLDHGEVRAALAGFTSYLDLGNGALREEAMAGRALALGRLGRSADEQAAWRELLHCYPSSGYAKLARQHLEQESQ